MASQVEQSCPWCGCQSLEILDDNYYSCGECGNRVNRKPAEVPTDTISDAAERATTTTQWQARCEALEKENAMLRVAAGVADGETVVSSEHGSVLVDHGAGSRKRVSPSSEREEQLEKENAELRKALVELLDADSAHSEHVRTMFMHEQADVCKRKETAIANAKRLLGR